LDLETYRLKRQELDTNTKLFRNLCLKCRQPDFGCFCTHVKRFDPLIKYMILIHPLEVKRRVATGRMSSLCLERSELLAGTDYSDHARVNAVIEDSSNHCVVLYPGTNSIDISELGTQRNTEFLPQGKQLVIFVIDGTWATAGKMLRKSKNLSQLPRIAFVPPGPSQFRIRKQPAVECYSTIEAIHHTIQLLGPTVGFTTSEKAHDNLIYVFNKMIERTLEIRQIAFDNPNHKTWRRRVRPA
jgi:DTW domain-containing protein YfiP